MNSLKIRVFGLFLFLFAFPVLAQRQPTSMGTDYWLGFMPNGHDTARSTDIFVASLLENDLTVEVYDGGSSGAPSNTIHYKLGANSTKTISLPVRNTETRRVETLDYKAIHVHSTNPCSLYGYSSNVNSSDGFLALPTSVLGKKYYAVCYTDDQDTGKLPSEFLVVAPYDHTVVTIIANAATRDTVGVLSHQPLVGWTVELMSGQTYLVQSTAGHVGVQDLTGSQITANKPIGLISGHVKASIEANGDQSSKHHLCEYIPPVDRWGRESFEVPTFGRTLSGDYIRHVSADDDNIITINGANGLPLNTFEYLERSLVRTPEHYQSLTNKRFLALQYGYSRYFNNDSMLIDPFMSILPSAEHFSKTVSFHTVTKMLGSVGPTPHYATFVSDSADVGNIILDGKAISAYPLAKKYAFANSGYGAMRVPLPNDDKVWTATSNTPFGCYLNGFSTAASYGYPAALDLVLPSTDVQAPYETHTFDACGAINVLVYEDRISPKDVGLARVELITSADDPRSTVTSHNFMFAAPPVFETGATAGVVVLKPIDPSQDGLAVVYAQDQSGNDTTFRFSYIAPSIKMIGGDTTVLTGYDLGDLMLDTAECRTVRFTNTSAVSMIIDLSGKSSVRSTFVHSGTNHHFTLKPGDTLTATFCLTALDIGAIRDSIVIDLGCNKVLYGITARGVTPIIEAQDIQLGNISPDSVYCWKAPVYNRGNAPLTVVALAHPADSAIRTLTLDSLLKPIPPGGQATFSGCVQSRKPGDLRIRVDYQTTTKGKYAHEKKDNSIISAFVSTPKGVKAFAKIAGGLSIRSLSPNPSSSEARLEFLSNMNSPVTCEIIDVLGHVVRSQVASRSPIAIDARNLTPGSYIVRLSAEKSTVSTRMLVK